MYQLSKPFLASTSLAVFCSVSYVEPANAGERFTRQAPVEQVHLCEIQSTGQIREVHIDQRQANRLLANNPNYFSPWTYFLDDDGDGFGDLNSPSKNPTCTAPFAYVADASDCNDANSSINPDAIEIAHNRVDENCDELALTTGVALLAFGGSNPFSLGTLTTAADSFDGGSGGGTSMTITNIGNAEATLVGFGGFSHPFVFDFHQHIGDATICVVGLKLKPNESCTHGWMIFPTMAGTFTDEAIISYHNGSGYTIKSIDVEATACYLDTCTESIAF